MKIIIILTAILALTSCSRSRISQNEFTLVESNDSIVLEIDDSSRFMTKALFHFVENDGSEILSFEGDNKILFYQLDNGELIQTIHLQKEGPNGVGTVFGHYPLSLDSVYITRRNIPELYLVNKDGIILDKYNYLYDTDGNICTHSISSSIVYSPLIKINQQIYANQLLLNGGNTTGDMLINNPLSIIIDEKTKKVKKSSITYPRLWDNATDFSFSEYSRVFDGEKFIYSFFWDEDIYIANIENTTIDKISAKSRYIPKINKKIKKPTDFQEGLKTSVETAKYGNLIYDQYRNVFYRFAYPEIKLEKNEDIRNSSLFKNDFSIIILSDRLEVIGETFFSDGKYVPSLFFIAKEGLYISSNHIKNPNFSEDRLVFKKLSLNKSSDEHKKISAYKAEENLADTTIYQQVYKYPEIINMEELNKMKKHKDWPKEKEERVAYSFIVEIDGSISNINKERGDIEELNKETLRLLQKAQIKPAQLEDGRNVRCKTIFLQRYP